MRSKTNHVRNYFKHLSLSSVIALVFILFTLSDSTSDKATYISLGLLVIWTLIAFISQPKVFLASATTKPMIFLNSFLLFYTVTAVFSSGPLYTAKLIGVLIITFSPILLFEFYRRIGIERLRVIVEISLLYGLFLVFKALIFYSQFHNAARRLASDKSVFGVIAIGGGYAMAYALTILSIYLFDLILNKRIESVALKLITSSSILLFTFFIIQTKSTLTILWLSVGYCFSYILKNHYRIRNQKKPSRGVRLYLKIFVLSSIAILLIISRKNIGNFIVYATFERLDVLSLRIRDIGHTLTLGLEESGQLALRLQIPLKSIDSFLVNPIFGRGYEYGYRPNEAYNYIGGHGEWVDALGNFGLIGSFFYFSTLASSIGNDRRVSRKIVPHTYIIVFVLLGLFNPLVNFHSLYFLLFIIPSLSVFLAIKPSNKA